MIGQTTLQQSIDNLIENDTFPRFTILVGPEGCGKKLIAKYVSTKLPATLYVADISVDTVRAVISNAYHCVGRPTLYVFADADKMSPAAKNALLKVTEEPPKNAYFMLTLTDLNNTLATIKSRGCVMYADPYTVDELLTYAKTATALTEDESEIIANVCETPGEVNKLIASGIADFYAYVEKVVDNIAEVSGSNSFKIAQKLKMKDTDDADKYDLRLFWKAFMSVCSSRLREDTFRYSIGITITSQYLQELRITGINKQTTWDMWLLEIRKEWM